MFPPEIFSSIFDVLIAQGKLASLASFSLVCQDFHIWVQNLVFEAVELTINGGPTSEVQALQFENAVVGNPRLAKVVKRLRLDLCDGWREGTILLFLKVLTELDSFTIRFPHREDDPFAVTPAWRLLSKPLRIVLEKIVISPKLIELDLQGVDFPLQEFFRFGTVKKLRLHCVTGSAMKFVRSSSSVAPTAHLQLRSLDITPYFAPELLRTMDPDGQPRFEWTALRSVTFYLFFLPLDDRSNTVELPRHILRNTPHLEELNLRGLMYCRDWSFSHMHPDARKTLTTFDVQCVLREAETDPYMGILESFRSLPKANALKTIRFTITVCYKNGWKPDAHKWSKLADTLSIEGALPALETVILRVIVAEEVRLGEGREVAEGLEDYIGALGCVDFGNMRDRIHVEFKKVQTWSSER